MEFYAFCDKSLSYDVSARQTKKLPSQCLSGEKGLGFGMEASMRGNRLDNSAEWPVLIEEGGK